MDKKVTGMVAYITWVGFLVAFLAGDKEGAKFHLNQALVILLASVANGIICLIPYIGGIVGSVVSVFLFICTILGIISAYKEEEKELPFISQIKILK